MLLKSFEITKFLIIVYSFLVYCFLCFVGSRTRNGFIILYSFGGCLFFWIVCCIFFLKYSNYFLKENDLKKSSYQLLKEKNESNKAMFFIK